MTNKEILQIAMEQSALDINCNAEDFLCDHPVIVKSGVGPEAGHCVVAYGKAGGGNLKERESALLLLRLVKHPVGAHAVKSGFIPAWVEMTVKPAAFVDGLNQ